ncbi:MAG: hypothetical protein KKF56_05050 [Nanoarchaeota archaeon]|nr:hypothetical protein [Nanoarchaeota archaeon]
MRKLTASQKAIIRRWIKMHKGNVSYPPVDQMIDDGTYDKLESINDTEILYQEVNRFAMDEDMK